MPTPSTINPLLTISCLTGLGLSIYSYFVEISLENDRNYIPLCDISPQMSCSKAFTSDYGKGFGIFPQGSVFHKPNSLFGILFYSLIATLAQANTKFTVIVSLIAIIGSNIASVYFAYILFYILEDLCVVCLTVYVVNFVNLLLIQMKIRTIYAVAKNGERSDKDKEDKKDH